MVCFVLEAALVEDDILWKESISAVPKDGVLYDTQVSLPIGGCQ